MWLFPLVFAIFAGAYAFKSRSADYSKGPQVIQLLGGIAVLSALVAIPTATSSAQRVIWETAFSVLFSWLGLGLLSRARALQNRSDNASLPVEPDPTRLPRRVIFVVALVPLVVVAAITVALTFFVDESRGWRQISFSIGSLTLVCGLVALLALAMDRWFFD